MISKMIFLCLSTLIIAAVAEKDDGDKKVEKKSKLSELLKEDCASEYDSYSCAKWQQVENGFCESIHGYEAYSYQKLDRLMRVADNKPTNMFVSDKETGKNRTFTFAFCNHLLFNL